VTGPVGDRREAGDSNLHCGANGAKMAL